MGTVTIKDIYAGKLDSRDEEQNKFIASFVTPPGLNIDDLLNGTKHLVSGYKGVGKTSVLRYLQTEAEKRNSQTCTSFIYFKGYEEVDKSYMEKAAKKLTALIDTSGEIQPNKVEYLHIWRWVFFRKIVDDNNEHKYHLFQDTPTWRNFVKEVNGIAPSGGSVFSLSSLLIKAGYSAESGISLEAEGELNKVSSNDDALRKFTERVDHCEELFQKLTRTDVPYYLCVDEMEVFYGDGDRDLFIRDLTLIRDLLSTVHRLNRYGKVRIIAAVRDEIIFSINRFIPTRELNKDIDGFDVAIKWSYKNTTSIHHPIIGILMKRIEMACGGAKQDFYDWFTPFVSRKGTVSYILDNGWGKPRDIVRMLLAAQKNTLYSDEPRFTQAVFDALRPDYSRTSLEELRLEIQALYTKSEIDNLIRMVKGGNRFFTLKEFQAKIKKHAPKGSKFRKFWDERQEDILEDFYRIGFWGNVKRKNDDGSPKDRSDWRWRWCHKGDMGVLTTDGWELAIHNALFKELTIIDNSFQ